MNQGNLSTDQVAELFGVLPQSVRHALTVKGHYCGVRPLKLPNRFLSWPRAQVEAVLRGERPAAESLIEGGAKQQGRAP